VLEFLGKGVSIMYKRQSSKKYKQAALTWTGKEHCANATVITLRVYSLVGLTGEAITIAATVKGKPHTVTLEAPRFVTAGVPVNFVEKHRPAADGTCAKRTPFVTTTFYDFGPLICATTRIAFLHCRRKFF